MEKKKKKENATTHHATPGQLLQTVPHRDWDCCLGSESRKFNLYMHIHAKHEQQVQHVNSPGVGHLSAAHFNPQFWTPGSLGEQARLKLSSPKGSEEVPNVKMYVLCPETKLILSPAAKIITLAPKYLSWEGDTLKFPLFIFLNWTNDLWFMKSAFIET